MAATPVVADRDVLRRRPIDSAVSTPLPAPVTIQLKSSSCGTHMLTGGKGTTKPPPPLAPQGTPRPSGVVGGRLGDFWQEWQLLFPDSSAHITLRKGAKWTFLTSPPLSSSPVQFPTSPQQEQLLLESAQTLLRKGAVEQLPGPVISPGFYSRLFLRPKPTGELRPIIDLSRLNDHILCKSFKMETAQSIQQAVQPGEWMFQVDIKDAYLHIPVRQELRKYLRFTIGSSVFQFRTLPFGLCTAPRTFTLLLVPILSFLRARGIKVHAYLDDWLGRAASQPRSHTHGLFVTQLLTRLGWLVNWEKSFLEGSQVTIFLGLLFDLHSARIRPGPKGAHTMSQKIRALTPGKKISVLKLYQLIGVLKHWSPYLLRGRLELRKVQHWLSCRWTQSRGRWTDQVTVDVSLRNILKWWRNVPRIQRGIPLHPPRPTQDLYTDASKAGWGAQLHAHQARGVWSASERLLHINHLEMLAVLRACQAFSPHVTHTVTRAHIDNTTVVAYINKEGGTRSWPLTLLARQVLKWCDRQEVVLHAVHIQGFLNVQADALSRAGTAQSSEWALAQSEFKRICRQLGVPQFDLMATETNRVTEQFISPYPHPDAWAVDVFRTAWPTQALLYAFPPPSLVNRFIETARANRGTSCILVASMSPLRVFHPELLEMAQAPPFPVCRNRGSLWQSVPGLKEVQHHPSPELFTLGAWLIQT